MDPQVKTPMTDEERAELAAKLDKELDEFIDGLEKRSYTEGWPEDRWQEEMEKHPFFMTKAPNPEEKLSPLMEGLQQLKYDTTENTPEELAATYKEEGNFNFKCKKYRFAILSFTEGIKQKCSNNELNAQLYNNRAAANYFLKNYRSSLADCQAALKLQPDYEKALVRAAQCCFQLGRHAECLAYCDRALAASPGHAEVAKLRKDAALKQKMAERDKRKEAILEKHEKLKEERLLKAIQERNIKVVGSDSSVTSLRQVESTFPEAVQRPVHLVQGRLAWPVMLFYPEYQTTVTSMMLCVTDSTVTSLRQVESTFPEVVQRPVHPVQGRLAWPVMLFYPEYQTTVTSMMLCVTDSTVTSLRQVESTFPEVVQRPVHLVQGRLVWPVMLLYPEYQTTDFIQEFHEDIKFIDQLREVFSEPPDWDCDRKYTLDNIRVYFEDPNGRAHLVDTEYTLGQIITDFRYRVDGGTPAFIIVVKGSKSEARLLQS